MTSYFVARDTKSTYLEHLMANIRVRTVGFLLRCLFCVSQIWSFMINRTK